MNGSKIKSENTKTQFFTVQNLFQLRNELRTNESVTQFLQVPFSVRLSKTKSVQIDGPFSHTHTSSHCCYRLLWVSSCELAVAAYAMVSLPRSSSFSHCCCCSVRVPMLGHKAGLRVVLVTAWADNAFDVVADVVTHTGLQLKKGER